MKIFRSIFAIKRKVPPVVEEINIDYRRGLYE